MTPTHARRPGAILIGGFGGTAHIAASGEFDRDNDHLLVTAVRRALRDGHQVIEIDMASVTFVSASVVHALLDCQRLAGSQGRWLWLRKVSGLPAYVLEITGTRARLCLEPVPDPGC